MSGDWSIRLLDKAMPHLSTHSQRGTLACSTPKPKGDFTRYLVHHFPGVWDECHNGKIRLYKTTDAQRDKYLKDRTPLQVADELGCKFQVGEGRVCLCVYVLVSGWSLNEEFGLEFKLSCGEQNGLQDKKKNWSQGE